MREEAVAGLVERIVSGAAVPGRAERDDLRRELETHFEEACDAPDSMPAVLRRFGSEADVTGALRRIYRREAALLSAARIAASVVASAAAALTLEALVSFRVELAAAVWRLTPGFRYAAPVAVAVAIALVAAREATRPPFRRSRAVAATATYAALTAAAQLAFAGGLALFLTATVLAGFGHLASRLTRGSASWLTTFAAFAATEYGLHAARNVPFGVLRALAAAGMLVAVCAATRVIAQGVDRAFIRVLEIA